MYKFVIWSHWNPGMCLSRPPWWLQMPWRQTDDGSRANTMMTQPWLRSQSTLCLICRYVRRYIIAFSWPQETSTYSWLDIAHCGIIRVVKIHLVNDQPWVCSRTVTAEVFLNVLRYFIQGKNCLGNIRLDWCLLFFKCLLCILRVNLLKMICNLLRGKAWTGIVLTPNFR